VTGIWENNSPKATRDTRTGREYRSRHQAGRAIAPEVGVDPNHKPSPWVLVVKQFPLRFQDVATGSFIDGHGNLLQ
jgi:hypothetical protein